MIRRVHIVAVLAAAVVLGVVAGVWTGFASPQLTLSTDHASFGIIAPGDTVTRKVELTNTGRRTLRITAVQTTCGCTAASVEDNELAPGESTAVLISMNGQRSPRHGTVGIISNDPRRPAATITVETAGSKSIELVPSMADFGVVEKSQLPATIGCRLFVNQPELYLGLESLDIVTPSPHVEVFDERTGVDTSAISVRILDTMPAGVFTDTIKIKRPAVPDVVELPMYIDVR